MKFQFFGFEEYLSKRYRASVLSSRISILKQKVLIYTAIFSFLISNSKPGLGRYSGTSRQ
jgi:hypothetical protein